MQRRTVLKGVLGAAGATLAGGLPWRAFATSGKYPQGPIHIIVPYSPGGVTDLAGRLVGEVLTDVYGQAVVVENRPGAGGLIGLQRVAEARPDGYTLMLNGLGGTVIPPATIKGLPLDIPASITPVAGVAEFINVLIVSNDSPLKSVQDLIDHAREKGDGHLNYGSNGVGSSSHLTTEFFAQRVGVSMVHVPYKGSAEMTVDVVNGNLDFTFNNVPAVLGLIQKGTLRALAVTSSYRSRHLPDVPTMQEAGVDDFDVTSWLGIYGPAGMPEAIVNELGDAIAKGVGQAKTADKLTGAGFEPKPGNAQAFAELNRSELDRWSRIAHEAGVSLQFGKA